MKKLFLTILILIIASSSFAQLNLKYQLANWPWDITIGTGGTLTVNGTTVLVGTTTFTGAATFSSTATFDGTATFNADLLVSAEVAEGAVYFDSDSDSLVINPIGFSPTNSNAAGTTIFSYKDGADVFFKFDSLGTMTIDGNAGAVNLLQIINDDDGAIGDSSMLVDKSGNIRTTGSVTVGDSTTGDTDGVIYFADDGSLTAENIMWDDGESRFAFTDDIFIAGAFKTSGFNLSNSGIQTIVAGSDFILYTRQTGGTYNTNQLYLDATGRVGINNATSTGQFTVDGNKTTDNLLELINDDDGAVGDSSAVVDKLGIGIFPQVTVGSDAANVDGQVNWVASDADAGNAAISTSDQLTFSGFSGGVDINGDFTAGTIASDAGMTAASVIAANGGITQPTMTPVVWATGGSTVLATSGNDTAPTNGPRWWTEVQVPYNVTLTGIYYLIGSVGGTDSVVVDLYNNAGTLVASSYSGASGAADIVGSAANIQSVAFTSTYAAVAGKYFVSLQFNGTTARFRTYTIPGSPFIAATAGGTYRTAASISPGTSFTANKGPISGVY